MRRFTGRGHVACKMIEFKINVSNQNIYRNIDTSVEEPLPVNDVVMTKSSPRFKSRLVMDRVRLGFHLISSCKYMYEIKVACINGGILTDGERNEVRRKSTLGTFLQDYSSTSALLLMAFSARWNKNLSTSKRKREKSNYPKRCRGSARLSILFDKLSLIKFTAAVNKPYVHSSRSE